MDVENIMAEEFNKGQDIKAVISEKFEQIQTQALLLGGQSICKVVLKKIIDWKEAIKGTKPSYHDYERIIDDITKFCTIGLSRKINENEITVQNNLEESEE